MSEDPLDALRWLTAEEVRTIHDRVLEPGNLPGEDDARPIESSLARIEQRVHYGALDGSSSAPAMRTLHRVDVTSDERSCES